MRSYVFALTLSGSLIGLADGGLQAAAPLPAPASTPPVVEGTATLNNDPVFFGFDALENTISSDPTGAASLTVSADFTSNGGINSGSIGITDNSGSFFLSGTLQQIDATFAQADDDQLSLLFSSDGGTAASAFGSPFLARFTGDLDGNGTQDFFADGVTNASANFQVTATAVPGPATSALLIGGLAGLAGVAAIGRRQRPRV